MIRGNSSFDTRNLITALNRFGNHLKLNALRAGAVAAGKPIKNVLTQLASRYTKFSEANPTIRIKGTGVEIARPHLKDAMISKVWRMPDGSGYINYVGPVSVQVPHAHWFGDKAPTNRYTRTGEYRGTHLGGTKPGSVGGGPARIFSKTEKATESAALAEFKETVARKIQEFQNAG